MGSEVVLFLDKSELVCLFTGIMGKLDADAGGMDKTFEAVLVVGVAVMMEGVATVAASVRTGVLGVEVGFELDTRRNDL